MSDAAATQDHPFHAEAKDVLQTLLSGFGAPTQIARRERLAQAHFSLFRTWLRGLETVARWLVVMLAAALPVSQTRPRKPSSKPAAHKPRLKPNCDDAESTRWTGVRFVMSPAPARPKRHRARTAKRLPRLETKSAQALALRFEACARVIENPMPHAKRWARRLLRSADALWRITRRPPPRDQWSGASVFDENSESVGAAIAVFLKAHAALDSS